jgi:putative phage-type endonuclease
MESGNGSYGDTVSLKPLPARPSESPEPLLTLPPNPAETLAAGKSLLGGASPSRTEWLAERRKGIGGSDAAAICGMSPFAGPLQIYLEKTNQLPPEEGQSDVLTWGHHLEDDVIKEFEKQTGWFVLDTQLSIFNPRVPFMRATLDGAVYSEQSGPPLGIFEGKTASARSWDWSERDGKRRVPEHVKIQCQHNMEVAGLNKAYVAVLLTQPVMRFEWFEMERDQSMIDTLIEIEGAFWNNYVLAGVPPPTDESWGSFDAVKKAYMRVDKGKEITLDENGAGLVARRMDLWRQENALRMKRQALDGELIKILNEAEIGRYAGRVIVTRKSMVRHDVDTDTLKKQYPKIADEVLRETTIRTLRFPQSRKGR